MRLHKFNTAKDSLQQEATAPSDVIEKSSDLVKTLPSISLQKQQFTVFSASDATENTHETLAATDCAKCSDSAEVTAENCVLKTSAMSPRLESPFGESSAPDSDSKTVSADPGTTPIAKRTRSHNKDLERSGITSTFVLQLPKDLCVTQHHVDYVRCEEFETATVVRGCMEQQWSNTVRSGQKVKVKFKGDLIDGVVQKTHYIAKLSSSYLYFYATAKADVSIVSSSETSFET